MQAIPSRLARNSNDPLNTSIGKRGSTGLLDASTSDGTRMVTVTSDIDLKAKERDSGSIFSNSSSLQSNAGLPQTSPLYGKDVV